ncbi:MAG: hypothetical protein A2Y24_08795 [Clostridiales bacterium GWE2_32_10]|nr:MAG: hypothetical protein A2Y24_08795 [Clostridiales bacterium GWE2_32_10]
MAIKNTDGKSRTRIFEEFNLNVTRNIRFGIDALKLKMVFPNNGVGGKKIFNGRVDFTGSASEQYFTTSQQQHYSLDEFNQEPNNRHFE